MKKRFGSFVLIIQLGVLFLCNIAIAENALLAHPTGQSLEAATFVANQATDKALPVKQKLPSPPEVKFLPPEETDERKKLQARWLRKDETGDQTAGFINTANLHKKHEIPRRHASRIFFVL